uniref:Uncharacterized protein n=1 Tax=Chrysodeixis includens nucleopolyhedrovirus TaxID=1207438 RepID=A0A6B9CL86_9ABAC|nr:hypothetical protein [Chrysodeixis includens nucleopolyhedrovirus]
MFVSTEEVSRGGLANIINMFAYKFIDSDYENNVCTICESGFEQYEPNVWTFRVVEKNKLNSIIYCNICAEEIDDDDEDCFKIALPASIEDQNRFEELLDRLIECGGVWLILNLVEYDNCVNGNSIDMETEVFFESFKVYIKRFGHTAEMIKPGPINIIDKFCVSHSLRENYINANILVDKLLNCTVDMLPKKLNNCSREKFSHALSTFKPNLLEDVLFSNTLVIPPENLYTVMPTELNTLKNQIYEVHQLNDDEDDNDDQEKDFSSRKVSEYLIDFLNDFVSNYNINPPNQHAIMPYCNSAAEAMYDFDLYVYAPYDL